MKKYAGILLAFALVLFTIPLYAQDNRGGGQEHSQAHSAPAHPAPAHGPEPYRSHAGNAPAERNVAPPERGEVPHVDERGNWIGHDSGPYDGHYHVAHPFEHGHFSGGFRAAAPPVFGLTAFISASLRTMCSIATAGTGTAMIS